MVSAFGLVGEDTLKVVPEGEDHHSDQEYQPDLLSNLPLALPERLAQDALNQEKEQVPTVEDRNREEIEDTEVDAEDGNQEDDARGTLRRGFP